jgi:2-dehydropantoate 2-reductase
VQITIVGGGVMGRLWAARLSGGGHRVTVVDASADVVRALTDGVVVEERDGSTTRAPVHARTGVEGMARQDVVFFFVKSSSTRQAAQAVAPVAGPDTALVTLQNGLGNADTLAACFGPERVVHGPTAQGGSLTAAGHVFHAHEGETVVGPYLVGGGLRFARQAAGVMTSSGIPATVESDVNVPLWRKRVFGAAVFPVAALTGLRAGDLLEADVFPAVEAIAREAISVAQAQGVELDEVAEVQRIRAMLSAGAPARASMLQDVEARRLTEVDVIVGAIADLAAHQGSDASVIRAVTALVHGRERSWRSAER